MNERIKELAEQCVTRKFYVDNASEEFDYEKFAKLIMKECVGVLHLECKDFANGNCFHDDTLWKSVTTEYGKNKERGFDPIGMSIHFEKILTQHFGVNE